MPRELLSDIMPIEAKPIVIDHASRTPVGSLYIEPSAFLYASLKTTHGRFVGDWAHEIAIETFIEEFELPILPPESRARTVEGHIWGPFPHEYYFIEPQSYVDMFAAITINAQATKRADELISILDHVNIHALDLTKQITDTTDVDELPGAFQSYASLPELLSSGAVVSFADFQVTGNHLRTSAGKYSSVFDSVVQLLGDDSAKELILELDGYAHPQSRRHIREELYIATQAFADLVERVVALPSDYPQFNNRSREILIAVLGLDYLD